MRLDSFTDDLPGREHRSLRPAVSDTLFSRASFVYAVNGRDIPLNPVGSHAVIRWFHFERIGDGRIELRP